MINSVMSEIGRPTKYDPKYCEMIIDFMSTGQSLIAFADEIGVVDSTLYGWAEKHPDFMRAKKRALHACQRWWEDQARLGLFTDKEQKFSAPTWIFNMKARFGYRDKVEHDVNISEIKITKEDEGL